MLKKITLYPFEYVSFCFSVHPVSVHLSVCLSIRLSVSQ